MSSTTTALEQEALQALDAALKIIPDAAKPEYLEALRIAPALVFAESDPMQFLRYVNYNPGAAALELIKYWKTRVTLFGSERAFRPLTLTGNGAFNARDIALIRSGLLSHLPCDTLGRSVVVVNPALRTDEDLGTHLRTFFHCGHVISANPLSNGAAGFTVMAIVADTKLDNIVAESRSMLLQTFPCRPTQFFYFNAMPPTWKTSWVLTRFVQEVVCFYKTLFRDGKFTYLQSGQSRDEIRSIIGAGGLQVQSIPEVLGGTWQRSDFATWCERRLEKDNFLEKSLNIKPLPCNDVMGMERRLPAPAVSSPIPAPDAMDTSERSGSEKQHQNFATSSDNDEDMAFETAEAKERIEQVMATLTDCEAYRSAVTRCVTEVWDEEVKFERFLVAARGNATAAAQQIVKYWNLRTKTFESKCFLSLYQTGDHALGGRQDLSVLRSGFVSLLPNTQHDNPVLCIDMSLFPSGHYANARDRCLFYMTSIVAEHDNARNKGVIILFRMISSTQPLDTVDFVFLEALLSVMPMKLHAIHFIAPKSNDGAVQHLVRQSIAHATSNYRWHGQVHVYTDYSLVEVGSILERQFGFEKECLPKAWNGGWGYEKFIQWQELRTRMEWHVPLAYRGGDTKEAFSQFPGLRPYSILPEEKDAERRRRMNVINCRRKRDRKDLEIISLQEECGGLQGERSTLQEEHLKLEELLMAAKTVARGQELNSSY